MIDYEAAQKFLMENDPIMAGVIAAHGSIEREPRGDYFVSLCRAIVGQQLSVKAAQTIYGRFEERVGEIKTSAVLDLGEEDARALGLSRQKYSYLHDLALHADQGLLEGLEELDNEAVITRLTDVKGIGRWTAEMFLMFTLFRPDIFAPDDLGLRRAMEKLYGIPVDSKLSVYSERAEQWSPWRTVASLYLWRSLDNMPK